MVVVLKQSSLGRIGRLEVFVNTSGSGVRSGTLFMTTEELDEFVLLLRDGARSRPTTTLRMSTSKPVSGSREKALKALQQMQDMLDQASEMVSKL